MDSFSHFIHLLYIFIIYIVLLRFQIQTAFAVYHILIIIASVIPEILYSL